MRAPNLDQLTYAWLCHWFPTHADIAHPLAEACNLMKKASYGYHVSPGKLIEQFQDESYIHGTVDKQIESIDVIVKESRVQVLPRYNEPECSWFGLFAYLQDADMLEKQVLEPLLIHLNTEIDIAAAHLRLRVRDAALELERQKLEVETLVLPERWRSVIGVEGDRRRATRYGNYKLVYTDALLPRAETAPHIGRFVLVIGLD